MVFNFQLNNQITYRDQRLRGPRLWRGLLLFMVVCGIGAVANVGIARVLVSDAHLLDRGGRDRGGDRGGVELRGLGDAGVARPLRWAAPEGAAPGWAAPRRVVALAVAGLAALTAVRLAVAATLPLAPDETYYWVWSRALAAGYLDHPPMVALWIRAGTLVAGDGALGIRLLAPLAAALGSWLLWDAGEKLLPGRRAGLTAAVLLNATLLLGAGAVTMTPDTPLLFFWVCTLWALARLRAQPASSVVEAGAESGTKHGAEGGTAGDAERQPGAWWLAVGLFAGLAFDSKYTAAFLVLGIGLWLLVAERRWLARPWPWLGLLVGLLVVGAGAGVERGARLGELCQAGRADRRMAAGAGRHSSWAS